MKHDTNYPPGEMIYRHPIKMNLIRDLYALAQSWLNKAGFQEVDPEKSLYQYFNVRKKVFDWHPRVVLYSDVFWNTVPDGYKQVVERIASDVRIGRNLQRYMSTKTESARYNDDALNALGIYHFHLSIRQGKNPKFVKRNKYLILAVVSETSFYFIKIVKHNSNWQYDRNLYKIIYRNWPGVLSPYIYDGELSIDGDMDDIEYKQLRDSHVTTAISLGNKICFGIGFGVTSDGSSTQVIRTADAMYNRCALVQMIISRERDTIENIIRSLTSSNNLGVHHDISIELINIWGNNFVLMDKKTRVIFAYNFKKQKFWWIGIDGVRLY